MVNLGQEQSMKRTQMTPELCANLDYLRVSLSTVIASAGTVKGRGVSKVCKKELRDQNSNLRLRISRQPVNSCVVVLHHSVFALVYCVWLCKVVLEG